MKLFVAIFLVAVASASPRIQSRITGGKDAKPKQVPSFVFLKVEFEHGARTCGGLLAPPGNQVLTSASCVFDFIDGKASGVSFGFGQSSVVSTTIGFNDIYKEPTFDSSKNTSGGDIAVITLDSTVPTTSSVASLPLSTEVKPDAFLGENLFTCGFGAVSNLKNKTIPHKTLQCTTLRVVPSAECVAAMGTGAATTPAAAETTTAAAGRKRRQAADTTVAGATTVAAGPVGMICTKNNDDRNACKGDYGSPLYSNKTGSLVPVGLISFYPDARPNARCQDGHYVVSTQIGSFQTFLSNPTAPPPTTTAAGAATTTAAGK